MVLRSRIALYGCVVGLFAFAYSAFADDPAWHTGKVLQIQVGVGSQGEKIVLVDMEPSFTEPCGRQFVAVSWERPPPTINNTHLDFGESERWHLDAATALLTEAMFAQSTVSVYLSERFNSSGERSCGITMAQAAAAGIRPTTPTATGDTGSGDTGSGDNDGVDWRVVHPDNRFLGLARSWSDGRSGSFVGTRYGRTEAEARRRAMDFCTGWGSIRPTCEVIAVFPTVSSDLPYCWAYAGSNDADSMYYGTGGVNDALNSSYLAIAERIALDNCREAAGDIGCEIGMSDCVAGSEAR